MADVRPGCAVALTAPSPAIQVAVPVLDVASYTSHRLHGPDRVWTETNCSVDVWIELLHLLGMEPAAAAAFALSSDFEGDAWTFLKFPPEDLRALFGIEVAEMIVWKALADHIAEHLDAGRLLTVEVDAFHLPDTHGVSYRLEHTKTTIVPLKLDRASRLLGYLHGSGYFELRADDFDGVLRLGRHEDATVLAPYVEHIKLDGLKGASDDLASRAEGLARQHLTRRPSTNPVTRFRQRLDADLPWLTQQDIATFHKYAFATCRQCGAAAELAASFVEWLASAQGSAADPAAQHLLATAEAAKSLQFSLARVARGRTVDLRGPLERMETGWQAAVDLLVDRHEG